MSKLYLYSIVLTVLFGCSGKKGSYNEQIISVDTSTNLVITDVKIFNGKDSALSATTSVLISNGIISEIGRDIEIIDSLNVRMIDGKGKYLMPGLIDSHVHLSGSGAVPWRTVKPNVRYNLKAYLYCGITTVYDLGGMAKSIQKFNENISHKKWLGPQIFNTHVPITVLGSHPIPLAKETAPFPLNKLVDKVVPTIAKVEEASTLIDKYTKQPIHFVKIICDQLPTGSKEMSFELLESLVNETHRKGFKAFVHVGSVQNAIDAVKAGADVLAHGIVRDSLTNEQAKYIAESGVPIIYTLAGFENVYQISTGSFYASPYDSVLLPVEILNPICGQHGTDFNTAPVLKDFAKDIQNNRVYWKSNFKKLLKFGANIRVGTDSSLPGTYAGSTYFQEMKLLKEYGMTNEQILCGATFGNASLLFDQPNFGSVEKDQRADLLLLSKNPLINLEAVFSPILIICNGAIVNRQ